MIGIEMNDTSTTYTFNINGEWITKRGVDIKGDKTYVLTFYVPVKRYKLVYKSKLHSILEIGAKMEEYTGWERKFIECNDFDYWDKHKDILHKIYPTISTVQKEEGYYASQFIY